MNKIYIILFIATGLFISGCLSENTSKPAIDEVKPQETPGIIMPAPTTTEDQSIKIQDLQNRLNKLEENVSALQEKVNSVGILTPSRKQLIPQLPFKIEVKFVDWQPPIMYKFKENGFVDIDSDLDAATYKIFKNNNTIVIESQKYNYYGLVIYDDYVTSIYKSGWPNWVAKYTIIAPRYNPETQKYELN